MKTSTKSNKMQWHLHLLSLLLFVVSLFSTSGHSQTILPTNSSPTGNGVAPVGWTVVFGSTDISNKDYWAGVVSYPWYAPAIVDPPNGHTVWVTGFYTEIVGTTITGLTTGVDYTMSFYMMESRSSSGGTPTLFDGTLQATIGADVFLFPFTGGIDNSWSTESFTFTAPSPTVSMQFKYQGSAPVNGNFWNISFSDDIVDIACDTLVTAVSTTEICIGEEITLSAESETGGIVTWDGGVVSGVPFTPGSSGVITYTATSTNPDDCEFTVDITVNDLPIVTASVDDSEICIGESVTFTGGGADTYIWDTGVTDGVLFEPSSVGTATYTVTGTNTTTTCENTADVDVTVYDLPTITATASPDALCLGEDLVLTGGGADTYTWDLGVLDAISFTPALVGTTTYTVTGTNSTTTCENTATIDVIVNEIPIVTASVDPSEICLGESVTFTGGGADTYSWDMGVTDGVSFTPASDGTVTYTVTGIIDATSCESSATVDVTVNALPVVTASASADTICLSGSITLTGGGADSYTWDPSATDGASFTPLSAGIFTYTVTGTNEATTCTNTASINFLVVECEDVYAAFSYDNSICVGECVDFKDLTDATITSWAWDFGGGGDPETSTEQHPTACFNTAGIFDIELTVTNFLGSTSTITNTITVYEFPDLVTSNDTIIDLGGDANLIAYSTVLNGIYEWTPDRDVECPECPITTASPQNDSTVYTVSYTDLNGCKVDSDIVIYVNYREGIGIPTAFSPNNDGVNDILFVKGFGITSMNLVIYNRYGEVVFESNDQSIGWDGTFKERDENPGVFTWVLQYNLSSGKKGKQKGNTTLIR